MPIDASFEDAADDVGARGRGGDLLAVDYSGGDANHRVVARDDDEFVAWCHRFVTEKADARCRDVPTLYLAELIPAGEVYPVEASYKEGEVVIDSWRIAPIDTITH